ncbi:MAG: efflux RND transporter periplasmic adaptor subunit, partial [Planctomycetaceae bacterium]
PYTRAVTVPAIVAERPGRTNFIAAAPMSGVVVDVFAVPGQSVAPGDPLFVLRLTNEDVVQAQTEFLKTLEALDVENREIARLESIREGVIADKVVLERKYERQKLEGLLKAQRQALFLHGMSEEQVESIANERRLLREFLITAPDPHDETEEGHLAIEHPRLTSASPSTSGSPGPSAPADESHSLVVRELPVRKGEVIQEGATLAVLSDLEHLYLEGRAFERDAPALHRAAAKGWMVTALPQQQESRGAAIEGLKLAYVANEVNPESRTLRFYVSLPNEIVHETRTEDGRIFPTWRYKPGQRMDVRVPIERWEEKIVLPVEAVAQDGLESYVFVENGRRFERRPVQVEYRDRESAVIANDGSLFPGESVALNAAHQLQLALKNQAGGGVDLHAGHSH